jgi:hypothetical protein
MNQHWQGPGQPSAFQTEIASDFTIGNYHELRAKLDVHTFDAPEWRLVTQALRDRIEERFLRPLRELARFDKCDSLPMRPGFAILALDCLLIDTIQSFREGRSTTGEVSPALSFKSFLRNSPNFIQLTAGTVTSSSAMFEMHSCTTGKRAKIGRFE